MRNRVQILVLRRTFRMDARVTISIRKSRTQKKGPNKPRRSGDILPAPRRSGDNGMPRAENEEIIPTHCPAEAGDSKELSRAAGAIRCCPAKKQGQRGASCGERGTIPTLCPAKAEDSKEIPREAGALSCCPATKRGQRGASCGERGDHPNTLSCKSRGQ